MGPVGLIFKIDKKTIQKPCFFVYKMFLGPAKCFLSIFIQQPCFFLFLKYVSRPCMMSSLPFLPCPFLPCLSYLALPCLPYLTLPFLPCPSLPFLTLPLPCPLTLPFLTLPFLPYLPYLSLPFLPCPYLSYLAFLTLPSPKLQHPANVWWRCTIQCVAVAVAHSNVPFSEGLLGE